VWVRSIEYIYPNIAQIPMTPIFPPRYPDGSNELCYISFITRWRVPIDDENTVEFAFVRLRPGQENSYITNPGPVVRNNYGGRPYDERQRFPGDFEAQIGQRSVARHGLEHLATTDRGVILMRRMLREGVRAVVQGETPRHGLHRHQGPVRTYGNDTLMRVPPANTPDGDREVLRTVQREVADRALANPPSQRKDTRVYSR
jgi:hypothetical protein